MIYVYNHLGLGDHFIVNGLIRELTKDYDIVNIFVKKHNIDTVKALYFEDKFNFIIVNNDNEVDLSKTPIIKIGFEKLDVRNQRFDESFYKQFNIPFQYRWDKFKMKRNTIKEKELFEKYDIKEGGYIFLHDDSTRNYIINRDYIKNKNLKIITPKLGLTKNMIDYSYIIENAKEIHCMDSSFRLLIDSLDMVNVDKYYHIYVRGNTNINVSNSKYNWKKIL